MILRGMNRRNPLQHERRPCVAAAQARGHDVRRADEATRRVSAPGATQPRVSGVLLR